MKLSIYLMLCFMLSVTLKKCNEHIFAKCSVKINKFELKDESNIKVDTVKLNSKIILSVTLKNPDSIQYENLILKLYNQTSNSIDNFQKILFTSISKGKMKTVVYQILEKDSLKLGKCIFFADLYNDTTFLDRRSLSLIVINQDTSPQKQSMKDIFSSTNTIIATNPEYYSYQTNSADFNTPLFFEIRIQQKGEITESNLTVQYSVSDSTSIKILGNKQQVIPVINPESPAQILNNYSFKIIKPCKNNAVGITITLLKENISQPIFSETYWLQVGSIIEQRKN